MSARLLAAVLLAGSLLAVGCGSDDDTTAAGSGGTATSAPASDRTAGTAAESTAELEGSAWVLESFSSPGGTETPAVPGATATLDFRTGGELSVGTGCNTVTGTYEVDGDDLTIALGATTLRGCVDPALSAQETALNQLLPEVATYAIDGTTLTLVGADGTTLLTYTAGITGLAGTMWQVTGVNTGSAVETTALTESLTAEFGDDGTFSGNGGCNSLSGAYEAGDDGTLEIGPLAATMMACEDEAVSTLEAQYTAALEASTTYELTGGTLTLRDADGATQVTAIPAG